MYPFLPSGGSNSGGATTADLVTFTPAGELTGVTVQAALEIAEALIAANATPSLQDSFLIRGGQVVWEDDLTFRVSAAEYSIQGVIYNSDEDTITLDAADPTNPRIDLIVVDDQGAVDKVSGTAAAEPSEPDFDPTTQVRLAFVLVPANATEPDVTSVLLYADNAGSGGGEWDWTTSGSGFNVDSSSNPRTGAKDIEGTTVTNGAYAQGEIGAGVIHPSDYDYATLHIRSKAAWANNRQLRISFRLNGAQVGAVVTIANGLWGFDSTITGAYQQVAIPITQFGIAAGVEANQLRIQANQAGHGFYIDDVTLQGGIFQSQSGFTQEQLDARYAQLAEDNSYSGKQTFNKATVSVPVTLTDAATIPRILCD
jgi:hypothetical protein